MKKKLVVVFNIILAVILNCNVVCAEGESEGESYNYATVRTKIYGGSNGSARGFFDATSYVAGYISYVADVVCVVMLMYLGIKYITAAPEGKAEVKKHLLYITIALFISVFLTAILTWIKQRTSTSINSINVV